MNIKTRPPRSRENFFAEPPFHTRNCNPSAVLAQRKQAADYFAPLFFHTFRTFSLNSLSCYKVSLGKLLLARFYLLTFVQFFLLFFFLVSYFSLFNKLYKCYNCVTQFIKRNEFYIYILSLLFIIVLLKS